MCEFNPKTTQGNERLYKHASNFPPNLNLQETGNN